MGMFKKQNKGKQTKPADLPGWSFEKQGQRAESCSDTGEPLLPHRLMFHSQRHSWRWDWARDTRQTHYFSIKERWLNKASTNLWTPFCSSCCCSGAQIFCFLTCFFFFFSQDAYLAPSFGFRLPFTAPHSSHTCFCLQFWIIYKSNSAVGRMVGFLAWQLEVLPRGRRGGEHVFVVVVMHTKMCVCFGVWRKAVSCLWAEQVCRVNWTAVTVPPAAVRSVKLERHNRRH